MEVEWLILADAAQVVEGKLFMLGGGWSMLTARAGFPTHQRCAVAVSFAVPWHETNQPHQTQIEILTEDGHSVVSVQAQFEVGRPAGITLGQTQRLQFATDLVLTFERPGGYVVLVRIDGEEGRRLQFSVTGG